MYACAFGHVDETVSGGKPHAGNSLVGLLSWHGSHFWVRISFCKVRHGDSVTKPNYYYYSLTVNTGEEFQASEGIDNLGTTTLQMWVWSWDFNSAEHELVDLAGRVAISGVTTIGAGGAAAPGPTAIRGPKSSSKSTDNIITIFIF